jgi:hypothetical protein
MTSSKSADTAVTKPMNRNMVEEEWCFIQKSKYGCKEDERVRLFRYELAREMETDPFRWRATIKQVFGKYFPTTPYLKIPALKRKSLWKDAFSNALPLLDPQEPYAGFVYTHIYPSVAQDEADFLEGADGQKPKPMRKDAETKKADQKHTVALIRLLLNFNYPDDVLQDQFKQLLAKVRKTPAIFDSRGGTKIDAALKQLAAARLLQIKKTPAAANAFLTDHDYALPYEGSAAWYKAKDRVAEWITHPPFFSHSFRSILSNTQSINKVQ